MKTVAVYNMKGGVGKSTTAVNLSYLAASAGERVLLWDLDPQAASSFAFRIRPHVAGFGKKSLEQAEALGAGIKQTDYPNLDVLPADFGYRKLDRLLDRLGKPGRVIATLLETLGRDYDTVFLDCPAGFSLLIEGVLATAGAVVVPTIPTVLSLRTLARLIKSADRYESPAEIVAFFNMIDRRKTMHRRACEWSAAHAGLFLPTQVPYASVVEQVGARRLPLAVFAPRDPATAAFAEIWAGIQTRLSRRRKAGLHRRDKWIDMRQHIESLIMRLESVDGNDPSLSTEATTLAEHQACVIHSFDTERRDLQRAGQMLELRELKGNLVVVVGRPEDDGTDLTRGAHVRIDSSWALEILSGRLSPVTALERRLGRQVPPLVEHVRALIGGRELQRIESRLAGQPFSEGRERHLNLTSKDPAA